MCRWIETQGSGTGRRGCYWGTAAGDALGAGYEFTHPAPDSVIVMRGGGSLRWEPGEWTDDTARRWVSRSRRPNTGRCTTRRSRWGASAIPPQWVALLHGYPRLRGDDLVALTRRVVDGRIAPRVRPDAG